MEETKKPKQEFPSAFSLFRPSFDALMVNVWTFLGLFLIPIAGLTLTVSLAAGREGSVANAVALPIGLASVLFCFFVAPALPFVQLQSVQEKQVGLGEALKGGLKFFWRFYGLTLLVGLIIVGGFILLIVPGFFMIRRYYLAQFYLFDQDLSILDAMRKSATDSKMYSGAVWGLIGVMVLIQLPGTIPLFALVSLVLTLVYYCAPAVRYFQIKAVSVAKDQSIEQTS